MDSKNERPLLRRPAPNVPEPGYDPEMLFVECARCGNPIVWERGRTTEILEGAGIDALELDAHCLLVTDGCPTCSRGGAFHVQIYRVAPGTGAGFGPGFGPGLAQGFGKSGKGRQSGNA